MSAVLFGVNFKNILHQCARCVCSRAGDHHATPRFSSHCMNAHYKNHLTHFLRTLQHSNPILCEAQQRHSVPLCSPYQAEFTPYYLSPTSTPRPVMIVFTTIVVVDFRMITILLYHEHTTEDSSLTHRSTKRLFCTSLTHCKSARCPRDTQTRLFINKHHQNNSHYTA